VLLSPYPADLPGPARRVAAVAAAMGVLWLTQAIPLGATSLIPLAAFPLLGVQGVKEVSKAYMNDSVFLYLGGFVIALGIERWGLHRRMALHVVRVVGAGPRRIVLGFAAATAFLSMWMSNTAAAMMMIPIALALLKSLDELTSSGGERGADEERAHDDLAAAVMLAVAYAATIGGMTTLVGTPTNGVFRQVFEATFPNAPVLSSGQWMASFVPLGVVFLVVMWMMLTLRMRSNPGAERLERAFFTQRLRELGPPTPAERRMFAVFAATALLWLFQTPLSLSGSGDPNDAILPGWGPWVARGLEALGLPEGEIPSKMVGDSTVAMLMATALFFIPAGRVKASEASDVPGSRANLMDWPTANRLPWEVLLLFGGGFALAGAFEKTAFSGWIGERFGAALGGQPDWLVIGATCLLLTFLSEFASNVATANIVLPILAPAAVRMGTDPRLVMVAATLAASCGFMLPAATPPNALVFTSGRVSALRMARKGFALDLIGVVLVTAAVLWVYAPLAGIRPGVVPEWATPPVKR
jgi:sodium-dependent dicarboxylate transporter 2/3/5